MSTSDLFPMTRAAVTSYAAQPACACGYCAGAKHDATDAGRTKDYTEVIADMRDALAVTVRAISLVPWIDDAKPGTRVAVTLTGAQVQQIRQAYAQVCR